jgi:hypothetical protein
MYRWHITDPVRFGQGIRVTVLTPGWRKDRFLPLQGDIASAAYWYQTLPSLLKTLPSRASLLIH